MISSVNNSYTYSPLFDTSPTDASEDPDDTADTGVKGPAAPSTGGQSSSPITDSMGKDDFMQLLVAQLKNQDPLNPMDGKDMAAQLAQFSSVEQLMTMNTAIAAQADSQTKIVDALDGLQTSQTEQGNTLALLIEGQMAVSTVGKIGVTEGNTLFVDRDGGGSITIDAGAISGSGRLLVKDSTGNTVATGDVRDVKAGLQNIDLRDAGLDTDLKGGSYTYSFQVTADQKPPIDVKTYTTGRITGLRYENGSPVLMVGDSLSVPFSELIQVRG
jgi:flagellar basal-body rod modification protein FlgD